MVTSQSLEIDDRLLVSEACVHMFVIMSWSNNYSGLCCMDSNTATQLCRLNSEYFLRGSLEVQRLTHNRVL